MCVLGYAEIGGQILHIWTVYTRTCPYIAEKGTVTNNIEIMISSQKNYRENNIGKSLVHFGYL